MYLPILILTLFLLTPSSASPPPAQVPFKHHANRPINPLKHLSAISPFYIPNQIPTPLPAGCNLVRVSLLIRHSSIMGNDDEYEQTMGPFIEKVKGIPKTDFPSKGVWAFLRDWQSPIVEETLEKLSERGKTDATELGKYLRTQYDPLFPPKNDSEVDVSYKVWTASSARDIETAQAYILGSFPRNQSGDHGSGDGEVVQLVKVRNKAKGWDRSLTPHKACDAWEKLSSLEPANKWLAVYAPKVRRRLRKHIPAISQLLDDQDILAMQMLCGYETIATGSSAFCHVFTDEEWRDVEYYMDVRFHYMMGYGSKLAPYLGAPWVRSAMHLLEGAESHDGDANGGRNRKHFSGDTGDKPAPPKLPGPELPPDETHSQLLFPHFTHRESPAFVAVFLNLFNSTSLPNPSSISPPLDHRPEHRQWRTSHLVSFLGHIALERFEYNPSTRSQDSLAPIDPGSPDGLKHHSKGKRREGNYVRAVVNGQQKRMSGCEDGIDGSCKWETWKAWVEERVERWKDWEGVCEKGH